MEQFADMVNDYLQRKSPSCDIEAIPDTLSSELGWTIVFSGWCPTGPGFPDH